ncbi:MAG: DsrE family protein [Oscillatoriaceae bacterium SKW80]|nr:DsrE family protein [Oscillatoriaceae bacterium SKYG93]MCX8120872.1 DsrE family protein [Oscillatoriaceae bacterium SKW80]MDW8452145.1 DsrE family protein [Oscillatoriaceae cyanobacterium SKYGB_i_bin93]HIK27356.1 DsrE family protein [Oscillatoriaceae cyanobacterium M7585_C2015_266]
MRKTHLGLAIAALILGVVGAPFVNFSRTVLAQAQTSVAQSQTRGDGQNIIIHLTHSTDDLHAAFMALKLGTNLQKRGAQVMLVLTLEGVRIASRNQPLDLRWGNSPMTLVQMYDDFVAAGGKVMVCPVCAEAVGITAANLRNGAQLAQENQDIPNLILAADKVIDF